MQRTISVSAFQPHLACTANSAYALHGVRTSPKVCQTQDTVFKLSAHGMKCAALSGDMSKELRQNTMRKFQQGEYRVLVVRCAAIVLGVPVTFHCACWQRGKATSTLAFTL